MYKISVIVCTHNRAHAIIPCLNSIADAIENANSIDAEIVVVDNASEDSTSSVVKTWRDTCSLPVQLLHEPRKGLSRARNCGVQASKGQILVFTDDDCRLHPDYIIDLLRHDSFEVEPVLRGGRVELGDPTDLPLTINTGSELKRWNRKTNPARQENMGNCLTGCNLSLRRTTADQIGPFDWRFSTKKVPAGEDADYVFRAYIAGITIEYVPDMIVFHYHGRKTWQQGHKLFKNYMIGVGALYAKHFINDLNLCRTLWWDCRNALKEIMSRKNTCMPFIKFSHKRKVMYNVLGFMRYLME